MEGQFVGCLSQIIGGHGRLLGADVGLAINFFTQRVLEVRVWMLFHVQGSQRKNEAVRKGVRFLPQRTPSDSEHCQVVSTGISHTLLTGPCRDSTVVE